jgi:tripartite-type tricarboxylate transporter receptor subunit TctC
LIVPWVPGGGTDILARAIAQNLSLTLGQPFVVDNRPGGGTTIGLNAAAKSAADGYTLVIATPDLTAAPALYSSLPFDPLNDFDPVALIVNHPLALVAPPSFPANSVGELVAYAKANPGKVFYASSGNGSAGHLGMELFKTKSGIDLVHVPYKSSAPAITAVLGGQPQLLLTGFSATMPHLQSGKLKALAYGGSRPVAKVPGVQTFDQQGFTGVLATNWYGVLAPRGTPRPIIDRLNGRLKEAMADPEMRKSLAALEADLTVGTPEEFGNLLKSEIPTWAAVVKASGAKLD